MASLSALAMARSRRAPSFQLSRFIARHAVALCCGLLLVVALWLGLAWRHDPAASHRYVPGLDEPLVSTATASAQESAALDAALLNFRRAPPEADFPDRAEPLVAFVDAHPRSPWRAAILTNLGIGYYRAGYFSRALWAWEQAWRAGRSARDPAARALADRAAGELARMHARLGHADELQALLDDIGKRPLSGPATELLTGAREGLWAFRNDHGKAYLCGPMALRNLLASVHADASKLKLMDAQRSGPQGFDLAQLSALASKVDLPHRLIHRAIGEVIPVPSVVHWKLNHYAAIVEERDGRYLVKDPTFASGDAWLTRAAIDAEASGFFLVPKATSSDPHWRRVGLDEARSIHGMGYTTQNEPGNTLPESLGLHEPTCNRMCEANAKTMLVSLNLSDVPVGYTPPKGPPVQMRLSYHQRESGQPAVFGFFNIGPKWSLSVQSWIEDDPARPGVGVVRHAGGGGSVGPLDYISYTSATGAFSPERVSRAVLVRIPASGPATSYELRQPDGTKQVFAQPDGATSAPRRMFLSQIVDPAGNALTLHYDAQQRLTTILDATGRSTTFSYGLSSSPLLVTRITDPFGRAASLAYDAQGRLASITDVIGITSSFTYDAAGLVDTMTTPYGTSRFSQGEDTGANTRFLEIADPMGFTERVEFRHSAPGIAVSDPRPPQVSGGLLNSYLQYRNTFYWDKHASAVAPRDYSAARLTHWLHNPNGQTSPIPESTKAPLEGRIWSLYPGQWIGYYEGSAGVANQVARTLDDGSTQRWAYEHNPLGRPLSIRDPAGRITRFTYAANDIDLIAVRQQVGAGGLQTLASATYDSRHRPLSVTDAAGSTTRYTYNPAGQPTAITDALGQATRYEYDGLGRVTRIVNPDGSARVTLTYDGFDRIASATNSEGTTQTYQYDALDRLTRIGYPDGSSVEHRYDRLDRVATRDRLGRITRYAYDANRRLIAVTDPMGQVTAYAYHANGVLKSIADPKGNTTAWDIDVQGRPVAKRYADGTTETYAYEPLSGRLSTVTDAQGQSKVLTYAVDDRPAGVSYANARNPTASVSYTHDPFLPRVVAMADGLGTTTYAYHPLGSPGANRLASITSPVAGQAAATDTVSYAYDALGRMVERNVGGSVEKRGFDALGRTSSIENALGRFDYAFAGASARVAGMTASHGPQIAAGYFGASGDELLKQLVYTSVTGAPLAGYAYTYDGNRNVASFTEALPGERLIATASEPSATGGRDDGSTRTVLANMRSWASPDMLKVVWAAALAFCFAWLWFAARRSQRSLRSRLVRLLAPIAALALVASCGGGGNGGFWFGGGSTTDGSPAGAVDPATGLPMGPSNDGSATPGAPPRPTAFVTTYGYDALDRLLSASSVLNVPGSPASLRSYGYDPASNLRSIGVDGSTQTLEVTSTNALAKGASYDASGNPLTLGAARLAWDGASRLVTHEVNHGDTTFVHDGLSRIVRIVERQGGQVVADKAYLWCGLERCLERDNLQPGSPITRRYLAQGVVDRGTAYYYVTDHLGSVRQLADAQGAIQARYDFDPYGNRTKLAGHADADMGFAGLFRHERSGLDLAVYRAYDPQRGRWLNRDPMREDGGPNLYGYVEGNPLRYTDRQGLLAQVVGPAVPILGIGCALTPGCRDAMADAIRSCGGAAGRIKDWLLSEGADSNVPSNVGPGPNAGESVPAGPTPRPTKEQQDKINEIGDRDGCHTCGTKDPGTKSGNWVGDHQDPTKLNPEGKPQRYYPQCRDCSNEQGGRIRWLPGL